MVEQRANMVIFRVKVKIPPQEMNTGQRNSLSHFHHEDIYWEINIADWHYLICSLVINEVVLMTVIKLKRRVIRVRTTVLFKYQIQQVQISCND